MSVFLGGGGSAVDEGVLWSEAFRPGCAVVVWPFAQESPASREATVEWMRAELGARGVHDVDGWSDRRPVHALSAGDVIAIPGGNTFLLLDELRRRDLIPHLRAHLASGVHLYGGSAGAAVAGADIDIAKIADINHFIEDDTTGLDLLAGADVLPHYTDAQHGFARERARRLGRSIVCIPERSGVVVDDEGIRCTGPEAVRIITLAGDVVLAAGDRRG